MSKARDLARQPNAVVADSNGRVGIGTSSPASLMHLSSTLPILTFTDTDDSATTRVYQDNAAFVIEVDGADTKASSSLRFQVDNTTRMTIDSAGRVTMPSQPRMWAGSSGGTFSGSANPLILTSNLLNIGSHFNTGNGRFTAPIAGRYQVMFLGLKQGSGGADYRVMKNGSTIISAYASGDGTTFSTHIVLELSASDYISFSAGGNWYTDYTSYSVQLVS